MIEFLLWRGVCEGDDFQLGTSSSVVTDFEKVVWEDREQNTHGLRRQNGGARC